MMTAVGFRPYPPLPATACSDKGAIPGGSVRALPWEAMGDIHQYTDGMSQRILDTARINV
jgi:hypothetical protein